jgi:ketosteroid isomerase-like protein
MSRENVDILRQGYAAFERGDLSAVTDIADPGMVTQRYEPETAAWSGPEGFLQALADWTEGFDQFSATAEEFIDAGDRVIVRVHQRARGRGSGVPAFEAAGRRA